jgi:acyl-coenzyme A thioesterase PaaI-like protein
MHHRLFQLLLNCYPPYWATGIVIHSVSPDYRRITVRMKMHWYNRNYVGTHFGGSLYAMTDPFYMLMLLQNLSKEYLVWDQSACIDFIKPNRGAVTAEFEVTQALLDAIAQNTTEGRKYLPELPVEIKDETGEVVARVTKKIYVRRKRKVEI